MGLFGVQAGWPYLVFGGLGAVGGGIGGYFVETVTVPPGPSEVPLYMLAGGMALVIPAVVISLNATSYRPPPEDNSTEPVTNQPAGEPPAPKTSGRLNRNGMRLRARATEMAPVVPMSLLALTPNHMSLGIPALTIKSTFTPREVAELGAPKVTEVHIPVFQAVF
jgi:hypothetical protein